MTSQWLYTGGMEPVRSGLNYATLDWPMRAVGIKKKERDEVFLGVNAMEMAALEAWAQQRERA